MKAIQIQSQGGLEVLRLTNLPDPTPTNGDVLVRIKASAVNPLDGIVRAGYFPIAAKPPLVLGEEAAGVVERGAAGFTAGERVIVYGGGLGVFQNGTWAELVAVPASSLRRLPEGVSFEEGADLVLDPIGGEITGQALAAVATGGRLVHLGYSAGMSLTINSLDLVAKASSILGFNIFLQPADRSAKDLDEVVALAAQRKYRALVDKTFPAAQVIEATAHLDERKGAGKVVLTF